MRHRRRVAAAHLVGQGPQRSTVLIIGDQQRVHPPEAAEPDQAGLARALVTVAAQLERGLDVDAVWDLVPAIQAISASRASWRLWRYDGVVVVLDGDVPIRSGRLQRALLRVADDLATTSRLVVVQIDSTASGYAVAPLPAALHGRDIGFVPVESDRGGGLIEADRVAAAVLRQLSPAAPNPLKAPDSRSAAARALPQDESARQAAVDRSTPHTAALSIDLQRVVLMAATSFGMPYAQINLVDQGRLHTLAYTGRSSEALTGTLSALVVQSDRLLLIEDTATDPRCTDIAETHGPDAIRFYAGYPLESVDGYRIGTLCVFDTVPHDVLEEDPALLRDIAQLAEGEINALSPGL